jgi:hypothetical protein
VGGFEHFEMCPKGGGPKFEVWMCAVGGDVEQHYTHDQAKRASKVQHSQSDRPGIEFRAVEQPLNLALLVRGSVENEFPGGVFGMDAFVVCDESRQRRSAS